MKLFEFSFEQTARIPLPEIERAAAPLKDRIVSLVNQPIGSRTDPTSFIDVPFNDQILADVQELVRKKNALQPALVVVIGIGGSHLGTAACYQACEHSDTAPELVFADTIDPDFVVDLLTRAQAILQKGHAILVNIITKSGDTLETIANADLFIALLKQYYPTDYKNYLVITTQIDSPLWHYAQENAVDFLVIPSAIGGRYSVFTAVGLFPLAMARVNIQELRTGAQLMASACLNLDIARNPAAVVATLLFLHHQNGIVIHDSFFFSVALAGVGRWYRQLLAESIGKKENTAGTTVHTGILPTVSIGTTDLHSVGQLYIGGPFNRFTSFVSYKTYVHDPAPPADPVLASVRADAGTQSLATMYQAILHGVMRVYADDQRPFVSILFPEKSTVYVGQYMQYAMMQVFYLGILLDVNPFDQPEVERYKQETKKILSDG